MLRWIWSFLSRERNRVVLGWLGGGIVVLASGLWMVGTYVFPPQDRGNSTEVSAGELGIAVGGDNRGVIIGPTEWHLPESPP